MKIYIVLTDTGSLLTKAIKLYTKQPYNHVSISFNKDLTEIYSFGRKVPNNPFIGGFVKENMNAKIFKYAGCAIYSINVTKEQYNRMQAKVREIETEKDAYRYNFIGLLAVAAHVDLEREYAYFCSQFVATILQAGGIQVCQKPIYFTSPSDIQMYSELQLEYEGALRVYLNPKAKVVHEERTLRGRMKELLTFN